jgi:hypothetical protein
MLACVDVMNAVAAVGGVGAHQTLAVCHQSLDWRCAPAESSNQPIGRRNYLRFAGLIGAFL